MMAGGSESLDYELWTACGRSRSPAALPHLQKGRLPIARHMIFEKFFFLRYRALRLVKLLRLCYQSAQVTVRSHTIGGWAVSDILEKPPRYISNHAQDGKSAS